jgi:hypothetical protein
MQEKMKKKLTEFSKNRSMQIYGYDMFEPH